MNGDADLVVYALRVTSHARTTIEAAWEFLSRTAGEDLADAWQDGLLEAFASLSRLPTRHAVAPEAPLFGPPSVRRLLYRRARTGPAYHILFRVFNSEEAAPDGPYIRILEVRHAAMAPLTGAGAQEIEDAEP